MKKGILSSLCVIIVSIVTTSAMANSTIVVQSGAYQNGVGGEFTATLGGDALNGLTDGVFQTFCMEYNEHISFGTTYTIELNTAAVLGGVGGGSPDPLDARTAWLYNEFLNGTLASYDYTGANRHYCAGQLQNAIWYLENEIPRVNSGSLAEQFVQRAEAAGWDSIQNVRVLNLYDTHGNFCQDVLCRVNVVPAPGALLLTCLGIAPLKWLRRRQLGLS